MTTTAPAKITQAVFAVTDYTMTRYRLTEPTANWGDAQAQWDTYDRPRVYNGRVTLINGEPVRFFVVRQMDDPEWKDAPLAQGVQTVDLAPYHFQTKGSKPLTAVREYAAAQGIKGDAGGWLRREDGSTVAQGWASYIHTNVAKLRKDEKAVAAALAQYFGVKRPQPRKKRGPATRTIDGIKWVNQGGEYWTTEDDAYEINHDHDFETECDAPHPVRIGAQQRAEIAALIAKYGVMGAQSARSVDPVLVEAVRDGKRGYHCEGGAIHFYSQWVAASVNGGVVITRSDTFKDAAQTAARYIRGEISAEG